MGSKVSRAGGICPICQEPDSGEMARPSSCPTHFFHRQCLIQWATLKSVCPLDKTPFLEVINLDGNRTLIQRFRSYTEDGRSRAAQLMRYANPICRGVKCQFCLKIDESMELAMVVDCKHVFHRKCVVKFVRKFHRCPGDGCYNKKPIIALYLKGELNIPSKEETYCSICNEGENGTEWAKPDTCEHYFHRQCLYSKSKVSKICPKSDCQKSMQFILCDYGDHIAVRFDDSPFKCGICNEVNSEKEKVILIPCCHLFHRDCLLFRPRLSLYCRQEGCCENIESFILETGAMVVPSEDESCVSYAKAMAGTNFMCFICCEEDDGIERAKPASCGCEFHRKCLMKLIKESAGHYQCPNCRHVFNRVQCLFGDDIVLKEIVPNSREQSLSNYSSVPDLTAAARRQNYTHQERETGDMRRVNSHANLL